MSVILSFLSDLATSMQKLLGLRNIAVHDYQNLNMDIVIAVIREASERLSAVFSSLLQSLCLRISTGNVQNFTVLAQTFDMPVSLAFFPNQ